MGLLSIQVIKAGKLQLTVYIAFNILANYKCSLNEAL